MALPPNWERQILRGIGAPATPQNLRFLDEWHLREGGGDKNNANFNPLNTTQGAPGAGSINSVGVKSYRSGGQGIAATVATLLNGHYGDIVGGLRSGRASASQLANSPSLSVWGTGRWGSGSAPQSRAATLARSLTPPAAPSPQNGSQAAVGYLLQSSQALASGNNPDPNSLLNMVLAQRTIQQQSSPPAQLAQKVVANRLPSTSGNVKFAGNLQGLNQSFLDKLHGALGAIGATKVQITSGYRSPEHNRAVGGAKNSNHMYGRAMDGNAFIPGRGWVPLGIAVRGVASKYGLRSGASFNWGGKPDVVHVDDGYNQH